MNTYYFPFISDYTAILVVDFYSYAHHYIPPIKGSEHYSCFTSFRYFIHPNKLQRMKRRVEMHFESKLCDSHCAGKEYQMNDETRQTEIQVQII